MNVELNPDRHYLGKLCPKSHEYRGTGQSLRYKRSGNDCGPCAACEIERNKIKRQTNDMWREKLNANQRSNKKPLTPDQHARKMELQRLRLIEKRKDPEYRKWKSKYQYEFKKRKKARDPYFALVERIRDRFKKALANGYKASRCGSIDYDAIARYVGPPPGPGYELDHKMPLNTFDLSDWNQVLQAFAPENHRWIPASVNRGRPTDGSDIKGWQTPLALGR